MSIRELIVRATKAILPTRLVSLDKVSRGDCTFVRVYTATPWPFPEQGISSSRSSPFPQQCQLLQSIPFRWNGEVRVPFHLQRYVYVYVPTFMRVQGHEMDLPFRPWLTGKSYLSRWSFSSCPGVYLIAAKSSVMRGSGFPSFSLSRGFEGIYTSAGILAYAAQSNWDKILHMAINNGKMNGLMTSAFCTHLYWYSMQWKKIAALY